jgi:hypothetical protein
MTELKIIPPISQDKRDEIDKLNPNPPIAKCGECGMLIFKEMTSDCPNKYCPVFPRE